MDSEEAVEVQLLPEGGDDESHCLVMPPSPSFEANKSRLLANPGLGIDDASTALTEMSTQIDDMSEKLSFGSMSLSDGGAFGSNSQGNSFDPSRIARARSKQIDSLVLPESNFVAKVEFQKSANLSLMDLDDDDDCSESSANAGIKTTLEQKFLSEGQVNFHDNRDRSNCATAGTFGAYTPSNSERRTNFYSGYTNCATPVSIAPTLENTESHAEFYGGYSRSQYTPRTPASLAGTALRNSESRAEFYGGGDCSFAGSALKTEVPVGFYRVSCSDTEGPLSCRQKLEQPAIGCDESIFQTEETKQKGKIGSKQDRSRSIFSSVTCCVAPTQL